jgi:hypothetical protein
MVFDDAAGRQIPRGTLQRHKEYNTMLFLCFRLRVAHAVSHALPAVCFWARWFLGKAQLQFEQIHFQTVRCCISTSYVPNI